MYKKAIKTQSRQTRNGTKYLRVYYDDKSTEDFMIDYFDREVEK